MKEKQKTICAICLAPAEQKCSGCQAVHYCSREHQKEHWKQHKFQCTPARVKEDEKLGRFMEATREIKAGDIVLKEKPLITGPSQITPPVCLGCYKLLEEGKTVICEKCGWPCCSEACTKSDEHQPECYYTQKRGEKISISNFGLPHPNYQCITVLRCLYQRDHDPKLWAKLQALQSHCEDRKGTDKWNNDKKMIADFIWKFFKLDETFSEEEIMRCCGIVQINGHEVPLLEPEYVAVFDRISMVEHNCRANCNKSFTSEGEIRYWRATHPPATAPLSRPLPHAAPHPHHAQAQPGHREREDSYTYERDRGGRPRASRPERLEEEYYGRERYARYGRDYTRDHYHEGYSHDYPPHGDSYDRDAYGHDYTRETYGRDDYARESYGPSHAREYERGHAHGHSRDGYTRHAQDFARRDERERDERGGRRPLAPAATLNEREGDDYGASRRALNAV